MLLWSLTAYEGAVSIQGMSVPSASCCYESQAALALFAYITLLHLRKQRGKSSILHAVDGESEVVQAGV